MTFNITTSILPGSPSFSKRERDWLRELRVERGREVEAARAKGKRRKTGGKKKSMVGLLTPEQRKLAGF